MGIFENRIGLNQLKRMPAAILGILEYQKDHLLYALRVTHHLSLYLYTCWHPVICYLVLLLLRPAVT